MLSASPNICRFNMLSHTMFVCACSYLSIVSSENQGAISAGVDRGRNQLFLLPDPNVGPLEHTTVH